MTTLLRKFSLALVAGMVLGACCSTDDVDDFVNDNNVVPEPPAKVSVVPSDASAPKSPVINTGDVTAEVPNPTVTTDKYKDEDVMRIHMSGIQIPGTSEWLRLYGAPGTAIDGNSTAMQNVWVDLDGNPKGIIVVNNADNNDGSLVAQADIVFLVDNSGSMSEEANAIAEGLIDWSKKLAQSGLDIKLGCVGYDGRITGGLNMTNVESFHSFLTRSNTSGTSRTMGWVEADKGTLSTKAANYHTSYSMDECGTAALRFADENFSFRPMASRVYVNFTDEPNYPNNKENFSVSWVENQTNWPAAKGVIHTVYSDTYYRNFTERPLIEEYPWRMSDATGGTKIFTESSFSNVTLESLPVTGALQNTYTIYFTNIDALKDGKEHMLTITVKSADGKVQAKKTIPVIFE